MVETLIGIHSYSRHLIVMDGGCINLRESFVEGIRCEYFNVSITEVGGDGLPTSPICSF
jgi:hypothetical protein